MFKPVEKGLNFDKIASFDFLRLLYEIDDINSYILSVGADEFKEIQLPTFDPRSISRRLDKTESVFIYEIVDENILVDTKIVSPSGLDNKYCARQMTKKKHRRLYK